VNALTLRIPFRLDAKAGQNGRGNLFVRAAKVTAQRAAVARHWLTIATAARTLALPLTITMTRVGPVEMDDDGNVGCFKSMRDEVAARLGFDDRSKLAFWLYDQRQGARAQRATKQHPAKAAEWAVEITIAPAQCLACGKHLAAAQTKRCRFGFLCLGCDLPGGMS
jgi:hypothetical protein